MHTELRGVKDAAKFDATELKRSERLQSAVDRTLAQRDLPYTLARHFHLQANDGKALHAGRHNSPADWFDFRDRQSMQSRCDWHFEIAAAARVVARRRG